VLWFFFCIVGTLTGAMPVANVAHGAGALLGGTLGLWLSPFPKRRAAGRAGLTALVAAIALLCTVGRPYVNFSAQRGWELAYDGYEALQRDDLPAALEALEASTRRDPHASYAWSTLGVVYARLGRQADAQRALQRAEELEPPAGK
jgi:cytochrome c-type biogenesis protein CcmH/NrfG